MTIRLVEVYITTLYSHSSKCRMVEPIVYAVCVIGQCWRVRYGRGMSLDAAADLKPFQNALVKHVSR